MLLTSTCLKILKTMVQTELFFKLFLDIVYFHFLFTHKILLCQFECCAFILLLLLFFSCLVHRIGRTGRCGKTGVATTFINKSCGAYWCQEFTVLVRIYSILSHFAVCLTSTYMQLATIKSRTKVKVYLPIAELRSLSSYSLRFKRVLCVCNIVASAIAFKFHFFL